MVSVKIFVTPKDGVLDPQGHAIERSLHSLGYDGVTGVRMGKYLEFNLNIPCPGEAESCIREMRERLLATPVIDDDHLEIQDLAA